MVQVDRERGTLVNNACDRDVATVFFDDFLADGQAQSCASVTFGRFEQREDRFELRLGDTDPVVLDFDLRIVRVLLQFHSDLGIRSTACGIDRV